ALVHLGHAPRGFARARLPALDLGADDRLPFAQRRKRPFVRRERVAGCVGVGARALGRLLLGIERGAGQPLVGERRERGLLRGERLGGFLRSLGDLGEAAIEQRRGIPVTVERGLRLIGGAQRGAARLVGL